MKYIKRFENYMYDNDHVKIDPEVGDYVLAEEYQHESYPQELYDFINNNVGLIVRKYQDPYSPLTYDIKYKNVPNELKSNYFFIDHKSIRSFSIYDIKFSANNSKTVKNYIDTKDNANKYNM